MNKKTSAFEVRRGRRRLLTVLAAAAVVLLVLLLLRGCGRQAPPQDLTLHQYAVQIPKEQDSFDTLQTPENGGGAVVTCGAEVQLQKKGRQVAYYYSNPSRSPSAVTLRIYAGDQLVAYSGLIPPGYRTVRLYPAGKVRLQEGSHEGTLRIDFYDPETLEKATVDGKVEIWITVTE